MPEKVGDKTIPASIYPVTFGNPSFHKICPKRKPKDKIVPIIKIVSIIPLPLGRLYYLTSEAIYFYSNLDVIIR